MRRIAVEAHGQLARITLTHPPLNVIDFQMMDELLAALQQLEQRKELDEVNLKLALETNENSLRSKQREKAKMTINSPSDGVVTAVIARVGDLIDLGRVTARPPLAVAVGQRPDMTLLQAVRDGLRRL